jgi:hypothetical protein
MPSLHCPTCGYNLTGLPENRCPECGLTFSPDELRTVVPQYLKVGRRAMMYYLLSAPLAFWCLNIVRLQWGLPDPVGLIWTAAACLWAVFNSIHWSVRATEVQRFQEGQRTPGAFALCFVAAMTFQIVLAGGPCLF